MKIEDIKINKILDSRGMWTIEVEILSEGIRGKASIPSGKSKGSYEAKTLEYEDILKKLKEFLKEVQDINFNSSKEFDNFLIEKAGENKKELGANFTLGLSIAFSRILAKKENLELWQYLEKEYANQYELKTNQYEQFYIPGLIINIIGGGVHSFNNLDFQEYWLTADERGLQRGLTRINDITTDKCGLQNGLTRINDITTDKCGLQNGLTPPQMDADISNADKRGYNADLRGYFDTLLAKILEIINKLEEKLPKPLGRNDEGAFCTNFSDNYQPFVFLLEFKNDFQLGADIAANQITKLVNWKRIYDKLKVLDVKYLEDPFKEDEFENFAKLRKEGFKVIGDDLTVTNVERLKIALEKNSVDGVIVKPNQVGTILETFEFVKLAKENNLFTVFSHRSGETNDHWLIDLGIAFKADFFKIGPPLQGERVAKYNRLREILEKLYNLNND
jgi:enolase